MKYDITALGEILIDFVPDGTDASGDLRFTRKAGGAPVNLLATAAKAGKSTAFIGKVGNDMFGRFLKSTLNENNIDCRALATDGIRNTTLAFVALDEHGDRDFSFYRRFGADAFLNCDDVDTELIKNSEIFHFGSLSLTNDCCAEATLFALETTEKAGCIISYDPNYRAPLWENEKTAVTAMLDGLKYADIVKVSREEAVMLSGETDTADALKKLACFGPRIVLMTDGANGVNFLFGNETGFVPSLKITPTDTTGAGDIFFGTFLSCFLSGNGFEGLNMQKLYEYVKSAVTISGKSTLVHGAIASIPNEIKEI